jgi:hypothetical protein
VTALSFYTFTTYLSTYLQQVAGMSRGNALLVSVLSCCLPPCCVRWPGAIPTG